MRGRNNNNNNNNNSNNGNRKAPNPLQRSYESNGPDVKVRGTAQNVAEKYLQLARDAQSSGDLVAAENYFQHAEHYYRILLAAQEQMSQQFGHSFPPNRGFVDDEDGEEEGDDEQQQPFQPGAPQPEMRANGNGNGYAGNGAPRQDGEGEGQHNNGQRFDRQPRHNNDQPRQNNDRNFQDRQPQDRNFQDRNNGDRNNGGNANGNRRFDRNDRGGEPRRFDRDGNANGQGGYQPRPDAPRSDIPVAEPTEVAAAPQPTPERRFERSEQPERAPRPERRPRRERVEEVEANAEVASGLPSFLTTPVRVPISVVEPDPAPVAADDAAEPATGDVAAKRPRRRRSPREVMDALGSENDNVTE